MDGGAPPAQAYVAGRGDLIFDPQADIAHLETGHLRACPYAHGISCPRVVGAIPGLMLCIMGIVWFIDTGGTARCNNSCLCLYYKHISVSDAESHSTHNPSIHNQIVSGTT